MIKTNELKDIPTLMKKAKWLVGKTLREVSEAIKSEDKNSRVTTKGSVGYLIEKGFFGIKKNSKAEADIAHLGVEIKTCSLKYNKNKDRLGFKEPLSLNIINYVKEANHDELIESSLYAKNKKIIFIAYIHDKTKDRSEYVIAYVFLWTMTHNVITELEPDYQKIIKKIIAGKAHEIHQSDHEFLTICPKHSGCFKDHTCKRSKRKQPFSNILAEIRAYRLKNSYMNKIFGRFLGKKVGRGGWKV